VQQQQQQQQQQDQQQQQQDQQQQQQQQQQQDQPPPLPIITVPRWTLSHAMLRAAVQLPAHAVSDDTEMFLEQAVIAVGRRRESLCFQIEITNFLD
jgi:hypothetical protein